MTSAIPLTVIGGYLGAGKTTLLNHLLEQAEGRRLGLVINDFGSINIDAQLIAERTPDRISLTNGCICCGMSTGFDEALEALLARASPPDHIVVEASGVADVVSLAQYGLRPGLTLDGVIVLADAETVRRKSRDRYVGATVCRQLKGADLIVLNKIDLIDAETRSSVTRWLEELAPGVPLVATRHGVVPLPTLLGLDPNPARGDATGSHSHAGHETYATWHLTTPHPLALKDVQAFIDALPATVLRAKGFFLVEPGERYLFQKVGRRQTLAHVDPPGSTELVVIGLASQLDTAALDASAAVLLDRVSAVQP